jgi:hypothetical protein
VQFPHKIGAATLIDRNVIGVDSVMPDSASDARESRTVFDTAETLPRPRKAVQTDETENNHGQPRKRIGSARRCSTRWSPTSFQLRERILGDITGLNSAIHENDKKFDFSSKVHHPKRTDDLDASRGLGRTPILLGDH